MQDEYAASIKEIALYVKKSNDALSNKIEDLRSLVNAEVSRVYSDDKSDDYGKELRALEANVMALVEQGSKKHSERSSEVRAEMKKEMSMMRHDLVTQMHNVESRVSDVKNDIQSLDSGSIANKLNSMEKKISDMHVAKSRLSDFENQLMEIKSTISGRALSMDKSIADSHVKRMEHLERKIDEMNKAMSRGTDSIMLTKFREEISEQMETIRKEMNEKLQYDEGEVRTYVNDVASGYKPTSPVHDEALMRKIDTMSREMELLKTSITKIDGKHESHGVPVPEAYEDLLADVTELKRSVEEETALRISTDKALQDLEKRMADIGNVAAKMKDIEKIDYAKVIESLEASKNAASRMEENVKISALKLVTRHMDEFAKTLDKKLPNIVTKDEMAKMETRIQQRLEQKVRSTKPSFNPMVDRRVENIEKAIREMAGILRSMNRAQPYIVE